MTIDLNGTWIPLSQSSDLATDDKFPCWQRSVKRKYNDSWERLQVYTNDGKTEAVNDRILSQVSWDTMPGSIVLEETSSLLALRDSTSLFMDKRVDICCLEHCGQSPSTRDVRRDTVSKKRVHMATTSEILHGAVWVCHNTVESEVSMLKKVLKNERDALRKLRRELEEERCASAAAANEAMAMITRLQEEKAAALVESRRYRQAAEERETFNEEAIALLKEAFIRKEYELLTLQEHIEAYKNILMKLESEQGLNKNNYLEGGEDREQTLFLEGQSCMGSERFICHSAHELNVPESFKLKTTFGHSMESENLEGYMGIQNLHEGEGRKLEKSSAEINYNAGERAFKDPIFNSYILPECVSPLQNQFQKVESGGLHHDDRNLHIKAHEVSQEQDLEDVTESILARVARLEDRFACLGPNPALEFETPTLLYRKTEESIEQQELTRFKDWEQASVSFWNKPKMNGEDFVCSTSGRLTEVLLNGKNEEVDSVQGPSYERVLNAEDTREGEPEMRGSNSARYMMDPLKAFDGWQEHRSSLDPGAEITEEAVHDIYEVHCDTTTSCIDYSEHEMSRFQSGGGPIIGLLEGHENRAIEGTIPRVERCVPSFCNNTRREEPSVEMSSIDVEGLEDQAAGNDLRQLKMRLQVLEGERVFMREAVEALRKENMELKLLQEIAEGLRELKGDVWRTSNVKVPGQQGDVWRTSNVKVPGQQNLLPFFSFLKGIFPFIGNCLTNKEKRSLYPCQERSRFNTSTQEQRGLFHLLNRCSQSEKSMCVTREHKVRFGNA